MRLNDRVKLMIEVQNICQTYQNDLKGKFYRIKDMNERDKKVSMQFM